MSDDINRIIADLRATQPERNARLAEHRAAQRSQRVAHIIDNDNRSVTYCGRMLAFDPHPEDSAAILLAGSTTEYAVWDDVETPPTDTGCSACSAAYFRL